MASVGCRIRLHPQWQRSIFKSVKSPWNVLRRALQLKSMKIKFHEPLKSRSLENIHFNIQQWIQPRYVVHFGNILAVCAMMQSEMLLLRCFMIGASICGITFNLLQPVPLIAPAYWGVFFVIGHSIQIYFLLRDQLPVSMCDDLQKVYKEAFSPYGFTARQFLDLCEFADYSFSRFVEEDHITTEGEDMPYIYWLLEGNIVIKNKRLGVFHFMDDNIGSKKSRWTGEFYDPNRDKSYWNKQTPHKWLVTHECVSDCYMLRMNRRKLDAFLNRNDSFKEKASKIIVKDLWKKVRNVQEKSYVIGTYNGMLNVAALTSKYSEPSQEIQDSLEMYARNNNIDKQYIERYLQDNHDMSYEELFKDACIKCEINTSEVKLQTLKQEMTD